MFSDTILVCPMIEFGLLVYDEFSTVQAKKKILVKLISSSWPQSYMNCGQRSLGSFKNKRYGFKLTNLQLLITRPELSRTDTSVARRCNIVVSAVSVAAFKAVLTHHPAVGWLFAHELNDRTITSAM